MTQVKSNTLAKHAITIGIPLALIAAAASSLGIAVGSWTSIAMAALAAVVQTVLTHFLLEPKRDAYEEAGRMGTYYNYWAALSALSTLVAIALVHAAIR
ncbi:hypothetical protein D3C71_22460 [compost metagenome]